MFLQLKKERVKAQFWEKISNEEREILKALEKGERVEKLEEKYELTTLYYLLENLQKWALLTYSLLSQSEVFATLVPTAERFVFKEKQPPSPFKLSTFCYLHLVNEEWVLETPLSYGKVILKSGEALSLLYALRKPHSLEELTHKFPKLPTSQFVVLLENINVLNGLEEEADLYKQWEFHDLLFHTRSRLGRHEDPFGGCYPFLKEIAPLPALKSFPNHERISLHVPDIEKLKKEDLPFTKVLEERRSIRKYGSSLQAKQLGEFLYRVARIKRREQGKRQECVFSNYPSGGALHALEIYPLIVDCEGFKEGLYHYDPQNHFLTKLKDFNGKMEKLLSHCFIKEKFQVCFIITACFQRVSWKYRSMSYALILKNLGVLYQTMYLVATAMDLAPLALGGGDSDLFSEITEFNYLKETSIGEFILGTKSDKS